MIDKEKLINDLKDLFKQNNSFLMSVETGSVKKKYKKTTIYEFEKTNDQLKDYIQDIEEGMPCDTDLSFWCDLFCDILMDDDDDEGLDDDNFPKGGW